jgi:hypothetical protein
MNQSTMNGVLCPDFESLTFAGRNNTASFGGQPNTLDASNPVDSHATRKGWSYESSSVPWLSGREQIIYDNLKNEHPAWPFTSFGAPYFRSLIHGDLSFEEYHFAAVEANRNGTFANWVCSHCLEVC